MLQRHQAMVKGDRQGLTKKQLRSTRKRKMTQKIMMKITKTKMKQTKIIEQMKMPMDSKIPHLRAA